jgi:hypothetical protein
MEFHAEPGTRDWLKQYEVKPANEPGRCPVPADRIDEFNRRDERVVIRRIGTPGLTPDVGHGVMRLPAA